MRAKNPNSSEFAQYCICCRDVNSGLTGDFIHKGDFVAVSPIFYSVQYLYEWMRQNGWETYNWDEDGYVVFGCQKI